ncbi:unnamed protein product [Moneuplotes crassus]|uniref:Uncharacterized protein n=1 Tax=Euplotes crassus TaxID=5936 RepID=A0AAD1XE53_EUPCR|nr:unnamed protein product [Moneuplotes crassus]
MFEAFKKTDSPITHKYKLSKVTSNSTRNSFSPMQNFHKKETDLDDEIVRQRTSSRNVLELFPSSKKAKSGFTHTIKIKRSSSMIHNTVEYGKSLHEISNNPEPKLDQEKLNLIREETKKNLPSNSQSNSISFYSGSISVSQSEGTSYANDLQNYQIMIRKPDEKTPVKASDSKVINLPAKSPFSKLKSGKRRSISENKLISGKTIQGSSLQSPILDRLKETRRDEKRKQKLLEPISSGFKANNMGNRKKPKKSLKPKKKHVALPSIYQPNKSLKTFRNFNHKMPLKVQNTLYNYTKPSRNFTKLNLMTEASAMTQRVNQNHLALYSPKPNLRYQNGAP